VILTKKTRPAKRGDAKRGRYRPFIIGTIVGLVGVFIIWLIIGGPRGIQIRNPVASCYVSGDVISFVQDGASGAVPVKMCTGHSKVLNSCAGQSMFVATIMPCRSSQECVNGECVESDEPVGCRVRTCGAGYGWDEARCKCVLSTQ
jgi:hypothetical protein